MGSNSGSYTFAYIWFPSLLNLGSGVFGFLISSMSHLQKPDLARDLITSQLAICGMLRLFAMPSKTLSDWYLMACYFKTPFFPIGPNLPVWIHSFLVLATSREQVPWYTLSSEMEWLWWISGGGAGGIFPVAEYRSLYGTTPSVLTYSILWKDQTERSQDMERAPKCSEITPTGKKDHGTTKREKMIKGNKYNRKEPKKMWGLKGLFAYLWCVSGTTQIYCTKQLIAINCGPKENALVRSNV